MAGRPKGSRSSSSAAAIIEKQNETLRHEIATIRVQRIEVAKVYTSSIERARNELVGATLPEVKQASGNKFTNAKIQSLDSEITVIHHSGGVSKVPTADLPPEIKDRLRYGFNTGGLGVPAKEKKETSSRSNSSRDRAMVLAFSSDPMNAAHRTSELLRICLSKQLVSNNERWCHQRSATAKFSCEIQNQKPQNYFHSEVPCINESTNKSLSLML